MASYKADDNVLSFHGPLLYPAKIKKVEVKKGVASYFVHYNGWNTKWDDWVDDSRLLPINDVNLKKAEELKQKIVDSKKPKPKESKRKADDESTEPKKRGRKSKDGDEDDTIDPKDDRVERREVVIKLPIQLKKALIVDWESVTKNKQLLKVPSSITVRQILDGFLKSSTKRKEHAQALVSEVCMGLREYFDRAVGSVLLYKFERPQFQDQVAAAKASDKAMCDLYGPIHMLRLFVKLPELLAQTALSKSEHAILQTQLADFLKYLLKEQDTCFGAQFYQDTEDDYRARVAALG